MLASAATATLGKLAALPGGRELRQLHMEITLHWHCLCDVEKRNVLEDMAARHGPLLGDTHSAATPDAPASPLRNWVEHMAFGMGAETAGRLLDLYIQTLRNTASQNPDAPAHQKLGNLAGDQRGSAVRHQVRG